MELANRFSQLRTPCAKAGVSLELTTEMQRYLCSTQTKKSISRGAARRSAIKIMRYGQTGGVKLK